jgi:hypothetical protein
MSYIAIAIPVPAMPTQTAPLAGEVLASPPVAPPQACQSCGHSFAGKYCPACGEKVYHQADKHMKNVVLEIFHLAIGMEGTIFATLGAFLTRPGKLSADYAAGIRKKYFKPIPFFLLLVVLYLLFPRFQGLNMPLQVYASDQYGYTWATVPPLKAKLRATGLKFPELAKRYDQLSANTTKLGLLLFIPLSALLLSLLFFWKRRLFFDHFVLATELSAFFVFAYFLAFALVGWLYSLAFPAAQPIDADGSVAWQVLDYLFIAFAALAFRRFYQLPFWLAGATGLVFVFIFTDYIRYAYNLSIFYFTLWLA